MLCGSAGRAGGGGCARVGCAGGMCVRVCVCVWGVASGSDSAEQEEFGHWEREEDQI